ncbi:TOBE-like domain-containing protein [Chamaesiphon minutus]|uniref:TOBE-like domain-containing protein n=1 Tax=Chamaesiphon minutus TaxID=1173032 RepID=UPI0005A06326|nr:TOBE-like domain-containing protein [Chamaesiphon minutus]
MSVSQLQQMPITISSDSCSIPATVNRVVLSNGNFRVELTLDNGQVAIVDLNCSQFKELKLQPQQQVFIRQNDLNILPFCYSI